MNLGTIIFTIYVGLTLLATVVGYAVCVAASHSDKILKHAGNPAIRFAIAEKPTLNGSVAHDKRWAMGTR